MFIEVSGTIPEIFQQTLKRHNGGTEHIRKVFLKNDALVECRCRWEAVLIDYSQHLLGLVLDNVVLINMIVSY